MRRCTKAVIGAGLLLTGTLLAGCGSAADSNADVLKIGAYSVVREVLHDGLLPAFQAEWKSRTGRAVTFQESYNGYGVPGEGRQGQAWLECRTRHGDGLA
jgi:sulfate transport system substrate-binding protein